MINLKLAEYDLETGKFKRFLELGDHFLFGGDFIHLDDNYEKEGLGCFDFIWNDEHNRAGCLIKDEKDPLNRFNGLFDGRTYEKGRFVLEVNNQDDIITCIPESGKEEFKTPQDLETCHNQAAREPLFKEEFISGNLHENPELWGKLII